MAGDEHQQRVRLPSLRDPEPPHLWRIGYALGAAVFATLAGLALLWWLALAILHHPRLPRPGTLALHDTVGVIQLVFASVAGAGALVALIVGYRRQRISETTAAQQRQQWEVTAAHERTRLLNERFTAIAAQLGDSQAAIRLAGVHAMAGLADDWPENRQTCVGVLCAYLRMPYATEPARPVDSEDRSWIAWRGFQEVRHSIIRAIAGHLRPGASVSWQGLDFDFTGVVFDGGDFGGAVFARGAATFTDTVFSGGSVSFEHADFSRGQASFNRPVSFDGAVFSRGTVSFDGAVFSNGAVSFRGAEFSGAEVSFVGAELSGSEVSWVAGVGFVGSLDFIGAEFSGGSVNFAFARFSGGTVSFSSALFSGAAVNFGGAKFSGAVVTFVGAVFSGGIVRFLGAEFSGGSVNFDGAEFSGGSVNFDGVADWSHPPRFNWDGVPPAGVVLPTGSAADPP